jgi:hypothetical protein
MTRRRWVALTLLALVAAASVSFHTGRTFQVTDRQDGGPAAAYLVYRYEGSTLNPVHPVTYAASRFAVLRTDSAGRARVPMALHVHLPFPLQTHPRLYVELLYVPRLHNAHVRFGTQSISKWDVFTVDVPGRTIAVSDVSGQPELWMGTLGNLSSMIHRLEPKPFNPDARLRDVDPASARLGVELIEHFRQEYRQFLDRYRDLPRGKPPMPQMWNEDDKRRWHEMVDDQLAKEPTYGPLAERLYGGESRSMGELEAKWR